MLAFSGRRDAGTVGTGPAALVAAEFVAREAGRSTHRDIIPRRWISAQQEQSMTRPEAIRRLVELGLTVKK
jgi:hypothetical protein